MSSQNAAEAEVPNGTSASVSVEPEPEAEAEAAAEPEDAAEPEVPEQRGAEPEPTTEPESGPEPEPEPEPAAKVKKRKSAPRSAKSAAGSKALVVFRDGRVHYADESVVVLDLDEAAHQDTDVHDVVDKLSELRDAAESAGRTEAISLVAELIQAKALS
ncbi:hypothetical protein [Actinospica robiniae]|uniref:hypothetical protein n=1 Tax=Actinospica robiniae TaxID=304901 RepID=UPI0012F9CEC2|nr:hypothetical protein [Actinospica robiniae]